MINNKRFHFGVIFSALDNTNQYNIWNGIADYASRNDINLTAFVGLYQIAGQNVAEHFDTCLYNIKNSDTLDGVIIFSGFLANEKGNEYLENYAAKIAEILPVVSVSYVIPGIPSVIIDNVKGIYDAVEHLIKIHGKKHLVFVKGLEGHPEADDRFEGYKQALKANGITYDERYVFSGDFKFECGSQAVKKLLESPELSADAIVACNDLSAMGVLSELKKQNMPFKNIAVTGFDDDKDSQMFVPSLSTTRQDFFSMGQTSAGALFAQVNNEPVEDVISMSPIFIARQSCGCNDNILSYIVPDHIVKGISTNALLSYVLEEFKKEKIKALTESDNRMVIRRVASNIVLLFNTFSLAEELRKSLPELSINAAVIGLYKEPIMSGDQNADRTIKTVIGFDGDKKINIYNNSNEAVFYSDYSKIEGFDFDTKQRSLFLFPLFFKSEELGLMLLPYDPGISVDTYETLRINISTEIKGARLIEDIAYQSAQTNAAIKAKGEFLSNMSHEMLTPMNSIMGVLQIIEMRDNQTDISNYLKIMKKDTNHLLELIHDLLDVSGKRENALKIETTDFSFDSMLWDIIDKTDPLAKKKKQKLKFDIKPLMGRVFLGDEKRLSQVITNLLSNAIKFTPDEGVINVSAFVVEENNEEITLQFEVSDNGIGISEDKKENIFNTFEQVDTGLTKKFDGTGVGLPVSRLIIERMGGQMWFESELGLGSKFIFTCKLRVV